MKLVVAIVQDYDTDRLLRAITDAGLSATRIASTGGFLRTGNTTVLMGVADGELKRCLGLIEKTCQARVQRVAEEDLADVAEWASPGIAEVRIGGAVVFVLRIARFIRIELQPQPIHDV
jgi:uncharacterized protein YaaQ